MKSIKFFGVMIFLFCISLVNAQENNNGKFTGTYSFPMEALDCVGEEVSGEILGEFTSFKSGKIQEKWSGEFVGLTTGDVYTVRMVKNHLWQEWIEGNAWTNTLTWTMTICNETYDAVVGVVHNTMHYTFNAKGEMTVEVLKSSTECY
jgi:hypothetical protein